MHFTALITAIALPALAIAKIHMVSVGPGGKLVFEPDNIKAEKGDQIQFNFESSGHSVAYGDFSNACQPSDDKDAFYSGFINSGPWTVTLDDDEPIAVYCSANGHCQDGMVAVINGKKSGKKTLQAYKKAASNAGSSKSPSKVQGGVQKAAKKGGSKSTKSVTEAKATNGARAVAVNVAAAAAPLGAAALAFME